jgi:hypothetical protein
MLKGQELIAFIKAHPNTGKAELARLAGYTRTTEEGKEQILLQGFYDASMAAHGTPIGNSRVARGKAPQNKTTIHASGILLIGKSYIKEFGAEAGDVFGIELREDGIWLPMLEEGPVAPAAKAAPATKAASVAPAVTSEDSDEDDLEEEDED